MPQSWPEHALDIVRHRRSSDGACLLGNAEGRAQQERCARTGAVWPQAPAGDACGLPERAFFFMRARCALRLAGALASASPCAAATGSAPMPGTPPHLAHLRHHLARSPETPRAGSPRSRSYRNRGRCALDAPLRIDTSSRSAGVIERIGLHAKVDPRSSKFLTCSRIWAAPDHAEYFFIEPSLIR